MIWKDIEPYTCYEEHTISSKLVLLFLSEPIKSLKVKLELEGLHIYLLI